MTYHYHELIPKLRYIGFENLTLTIIQLSLVVCDKLKSHFHRATHDIRYNSKQIVI